MKRLYNTPFQIKFKTGLSSDINSLTTKSFAVQGEPHYTTDTEELYIFTGTENKLIKYKLEGTRYLYVKADGTDVENATELQTAYNTAKTMSPTATNRVVVICGPGNYNFSSAFVMDAEFIDLVSLDGNRSIFFNGQSISVNANDVFIKGVESPNIVITKDNANLLRVENCKGGNGSFGSASTTFSILSGTFINCEAGDTSFAYNCEASGTFINCKVGDDSFGGGGPSSLASGYFKDCIGGKGCFGRQNATGVFINCESTGDSSFGSGSGSISSGFCKNCKSGNFSFGSQSRGIYIDCEAGDTSFGYDSFFATTETTGLYINCKAGANSFTGSQQELAIFKNCSVNDSLKVFKYTTNQIHFKNIPGSLFGESGTPLTGNLTQDLTKANSSQIQKIYHDDIVEPTYPATWKKNGNINYMVDASAQGLVNVIFVEYMSSGRQVYWISQEEL